MCDQIFEKRPVTTHLRNVSTAFGVMQDREAVASRYRVRGAGALTAVQAAAGIAEAHVLHAPAPRA